MRRSGASGRGHAEAWNCRRPARIAATRLWLAAISGVAFALLCAAPPEAFGKGCRPTRPKPPVVLRSMGPCAFDRERLSYAGDPVQQTACLVRSVGQWAKLGPTLPTVPTVLAVRVGSDFDLPARETLSGYLSKLDLQNDFAAYLWRPLARARDNDPEAPNARYFVIHDTSGPRFYGKSFPADIDDDPKINRLARFFCEDGWGIAHVIVNRSGGMLLSHELEIPWRATKFERAVGFGLDLKGLFMHVEMIQPRRGAGRRGADIIAPQPGFTQAQYDRLALLYAIMSVRAERWLIPAFHAVIDNGIRNGHDDPQNFELEKFAASLESLLVRLQVHDQERIGIARAALASASGR